MPAECEVLVTGRPCAVLAIRRCTNCWRAYCLTHQYLRRLSSGTEATDECSECGTSRDQSLQEQRAKVDRDKAAIRERIRLAAARLSQVGPPSRLQLMEPVWKRTIGRKGNGYYQYLPASRQAWFVGEFEWSISGSYSSFHTAVLEDGSIVKVVPIPEMQGQFQVGPGGGRLFNETDLMAIADRVEELTR